MKKLTIVLVACFIILGSSAFAGLTKEGFMSEKDEYRKGMDKIHTFSFPSIEFSERGKYVKIYKAILIFS